MATEIPDQTATVDVLFTYQFPDTTFADADTGDTLSYTATKGDDTALPTWLTFNATTRTFSGTPTATDVETLAVKVTASDGTDSVTDTFDIVVAADTACPAPTGRRNIWRGTLTPGQGQTSTINGYNGEAFGTVATFGSLTSPTSFTIDSDTYSILSLWVANDRLLFRSSPVLSSAHLDALRVHICHTVGTFQYDFDGSTEFTTSGQTFRQWTNTGMESWTGVNNAGVRTIYLSLPENTAATGKPSITGTAQVGQTLTAAAGDIADDDGLPTSFAYQWVREDTDGTNAEDITGETSTTYALTAADEGKKVKVRVSFTDQLGSAESRTSDPYPGEGKVTTLPAITIKANRTRAAAWVHQVTYTLTRGRHRGRAHRDRRLQRPHGARLGEPELSNEQSMRCDVRRGQRDRDTHEAHSGRIPRNRLLELRHRVGKAHRLGRDRDRLRHQRHRGGECDCAPGGGGAVRGALHDGQLRARRGRRGLHRHHRGGSAIDRR